jgi:hypothetical protein
MDEMQADSTEEIERCLVGGMGIAPIALHVATRRVELITLEGVECYEPFFQQTLQRLALDRPDVLRAEIDLDRFVRAVPRDRPAPDGFIFHTGRCGSTLLANLLAASGRYSVLREPGIVIDLSLAWLEADDTTRRELESLFELILPQMLWATAGAARYRLLKPAAWNIQVAQTLLRIFPTTPAVFLYRAPSETVASMLFDPPGWLEWIWRPQSFRARCMPSLRTFPRGEKLSPAILFAHAWRSAVEAALALPPERLLLLDYADMVSDPADSLKRVLTHFRQPVDPEIIAAMLTTRSIYSKDPARAERFDPNGAHRRPLLSCEELSGVDRVVGDIWRSLRAQELV